MRRLNQQRGTSCLLAFSWRQHPQLTVLRMSPGLHGRNSLLFSHIWWCKWTDEKIISQGKRKQHVKQTGCVDGKSLYVTDFNPCKLNYCRVALLLFTNTSATCAKSGCKAIKRSLIQFDLENPISENSWSLFHMWAHYVDTGEPQSTIFCVNDGIINKTYMSDWLMSSKVAEAERYLKTLWEMDKWRICQNQISHWCAFYCYVTTALRQCVVKSFHTGKAGGNLPADYQLGLTAI